MTRMQLILPRRDGEGAIATPANSVHFLPCTVHADRAAPVSKYFVVEPASVPTATGTDSAAVSAAPEPAFRSSFRGRRLEGKVPDTHGYTVLRAQPASGRDPTTGEHAEDSYHDEPMEEETSARSDLEVRAVGHLANPIVWDHDQLPTVYESAVMRGFEWAWLMNEVHRPVEYPAETEEATSD
ncbi:hypothetical protein H9P43_002614 [Blastocladiella emersonii ATCC 22665]|nr:hypothetical protein H9P43_002614 [Blastocladiella emersonii ATCC 22665]